jgi:poly(3-hydroxybutyrate) depolymerase
MSTRSVSLCTFGIHRHLGLLGLALWAFACSSPSGSGSEEGSSGSTAATGGGSSGGAVGASGGSGATTGGVNAGGAASGGAASGGAASGGAASGGAASGGAASGGAASGGAASGGSTNTEGRSAGCEKDPTIPSSQYNNGTTIPIKAAGVDRRYILNVPTNYDNTKAYKLVIAWHQLDGNDKQMYQNGYYHLLNLSQDSTIFVAPNGVRRDNGQPCTGTGNGESGCGWPNPNDSDMALGDAVVAQIEENFCVDTNRIFATGWSYGGSMSYANACERPLGGVSNGYIRAAAIYSGAVMSPFNGCTPSKPVAYYSSHGTGDDILDYDGGVTMSQNWATVNGCTWATPTRVTSGNHVCTKLSGCSTGYPVEFCSFNGPHTPDPSDGGGGSWQYQEVWTFFSQF